MAPSGKDLRSFTKAELIKMIMVSKEGSNYFISSCLSESLVSFMVDKVLLLVKPLLEVYTAKLCHEITALFSQVNGMHSQLDKVTNATCINPSASHAQTPAGSIADAIRDTVKETFDGEKAKTRIIVSA